MGWKLATLPFSGVAGQTVTLSFTDTTNSSCGMTLDVANVKGA
jgi:hypothetical protein